MAVTKGIHALIDEAMTQIKTYSVDEVRARMERKDPTLQLVDIRDVRELESKGTLPYAFHAPRGMLEFWVDPESPYFKSVFGHDDREYVLFCGSAWRSALSTKALQDMGMRNVAHLGGGFSAWSEAGAPTETLAENQARHLW